MSWANLTPFMLGVLKTQSPKHRPQNADLNNTDLENADLENVVQVCNNWEALFFSPQWEKENWKEPKTIIENGLGLLKNWASWNFQDGRGIVDSDSFLLWLQVRLLFAKTQAQNTCEWEFHQVRYSYIFIRKLSNESDKEMLANEHTCRRQEHNTLTGNQTSDYDEVLQWKKSQLN